MPETALSDIQVLELSEGVSGAYCTKLLADFGAETIKVEEPGNGDPIRKMGPFLKDEAHPEKSEIFFYLNTNKKSITLNLNSESGVKIFKELVKKADILVESFAPEMTSEMGLSYENLGQINPRLVMISISNFGQTGPYRDYKATNLTLQGLGGAMYTMRPPDKPEDRPVTQGGLQAWYTTGLLSFIAGLAALTNRVNTGAGVWVDMSSMECVASTLTGVAADYPYIGVSRRTGLIPVHGHPSTYNYPCKDGWINPTPGLGGAPNIALLIGKPELQNDPLFARPGPRASEPEKFDALLLPWFKEHGKWEITKQAQELKLAFAPILTPGELLKDEQLEVRKFFSQVDHPVMGEVKYPGAPAKLSESPWREGRSPLLGEHNEEVYGRLGYSKEEIVRLEGEGVV